MMLLFDISFSLTPDSWRLTPSIIFIHIYINLAAC
jgi:hypothetical protein